MRKDFSVERFIKVIKRLGPADMEVLLELESYFKKPGLGDEKYLVDAKKRVNLNTLFINALNPRTRELTSLQQLLLKEYKSISSSPMPISLEGVKEIARALEELSNKFEIKPKKIISAEMFIDSLRKYPKDSDEEGSASSTPTINEGDEIDSTITDSEVTSSTEMPSPGRAQKVMARGSQEALPGFSMQSQAIHIKIPEGTTDMSPYQTKLVELNEQGRLSSLSIENCTPQQLDALLSFPQHDNWQDKVVDPYVYWTESQPSSLETLKILNTRASDIGKPRIRIDAPDPASAITPVLERALENNTSVKTLILNNVPLPVADLSALAELCRLHTTMQTLDLSNNHLDDQSDEVIGHLIYYAWALKRINLTNNAFTPGGNAEAIIYAVVDQLRQEGHSVETIGLSPQKIIQHKSEATMPPFVQVVTARVPEEVPNHPDQTRALEATKIKKTTAVAVSPVFEPPLTAQNSQKYFDKLESVGQETISVRPASQSEDLYTIDMGEGNSKTTDHYLDEIKKLKKVPSKVIIKYANPSQLNDLLAGFSKIQVTEFELDHCTSSLNQTMMDVVTQQLQDRAGLIKLILNASLNAQSDGAKSEFVKLDQFIANNHKKPKYEQIATFSLPNNALQDKDLGFLPHLNQCERLDLSSNRILGPGILSLWDPLSTKPLSNTLEYLTLDHNPVMHDANMQLKIGKQMVAHDISCLLPAFEKAAGEMLEKIHARRTANIKKQLQETIASSSDVSPKLGGSHFKS